MVCLQWVRVEWQGSPSLKKRVSVFVDYKMPVVLSPACTHLLIDMSLYWLAILGTCSLYRMPAEHQRLNAITCWDFAMSAGITHLESVVEGHVGWPLTGKKNSLLWTYESLKMRMFIWVNLCQYHWREKKKKGYISMHGILTDTNLINKKLATLGKKGK